MKRFLIICLSICISVYAHAQATDLVIDNQTPGWLSSKINYGDQQTVRNLKVTGYVNNADLYFIGNLISKRSLNGVLDIGMVTLIGEGGKPDNHFDGRELLSTNISDENRKTLTKLVCPNSATSATYVGSGLISIDTLVYNCKTSSLGTDQIYSRVKINNVILGENISTIKKIPNKIQSVIFPSSLRILEDFAFSESLRDLSQTNINEFPNLEYLGYEVFVNNDNAQESNKETLPDTICLPKIKEYHISAFDYKEGMHIYLGKDIEKVYYYPKTAYTYTWYPSLENVTFHIAAMTPPGTGIRLSPWNGGLTVYVPKEAVENYKKDYGWGKANILAEPVPLEGIELKEHEIVIEANETYQLSAMPIPANADDATIMWVSSNENIADVNETGLVTAISSGEAQIIAKSTDGSKQDFCKVVVKTHAESVIIDQTSLSISNIGDTYQLEATILPASTTDKSVIWKSSNEQVCTVSEAGLVTATGVGTAVVTVTTVDGGHTATCTIKVIQHVTDIALNKNNVSLKVGESDLLKVTVNPANADNKSVVWSSSNEQIATVDANGNVKAMKAGEAWIKAVSEDNAQAKDSCKVTVIQPVTGVTLSQNSYRLTNIGENIQLEATVEPEDASNKEVKWSSSDESVCIVANGKVVATGFGTAVVMAITADGGFMATCAIVVEKETIPVTDVTLSQTQALLIEGERLQLTATVKPNDATNKTLIWKSSDETICVVTQAGLLIAMAEGEAIVSVIPENGVGQAQCNVTVISKENAAIEDVMDDGSSSVPVYDMMGCKVTHLVKGRLYIRNGQKFIAQ